MEPPTTLDKNAQAVIHYLNAQVEAGAQALMVFDTWGGVLSPANYQEISLRYMQQIVDGVTREAEGRKVLDSYGDSPGHVFNLGHGIHQFVNPENLTVVVEPVPELSTR